MDAYYPDEPPYQGGATSQYSGQWQFRGAASPSPGQPQYYGPPAQSYRAQPQGYEPPSQQAQYQGPPAQSYRAQSQAYEPPSQYYAQQVRHYGQPAEFPYDYFPQPIDREYRYPVYAQQQEPVYADMVPPMQSHRPFVDRPYEPHYLKNVQEFPHQQELEEEALREQMFVMEKDFDFQIRRILKIQQEEVRAKEMEIDALRNDNYIKADRNMKIYNNYVVWNETLQKKMPENEVAQQMQKAVDVLKPDIEDNYTEHHPLLKELAHELQFLARENQDLYERRKKLERRLYLEDSKRELVFGALPSAEL